jgi:tetratricopeptide (TPR) repeat protein
MLNFRCPLITVLAIGVLVAACASPEERAAQFVADARQYYAAGDLKAALLQAQNATQIDPKSADARFLMAEIHEKEGNLREVVSNLLIAVDSEPDHLQAQLKLGTLFFYAQSWDQATKYAAAAAAIAPEDAEVRLLQARLDFQQQRYDEGMQLLDAVISKDPDNLDAIVLKVMGIARSDPEQALIAVDGFISRVEPRKTQALRRVRLGLLDDKAEPGSVERELQALIADYPDERDFPLQLTSYYLQKGRTDEAEKLMRDMVARQPDDVNLRLSLVQFLANARSPALAETTLKAFIAERPADLQLRQALGRRYEATGRTAEATAIYRELAALDPKSVEGLAARREIAKLAFAAGQVENGRREIDAVLKDAPDDPDALVLRAGLHFDARRFDESIADLRIALRKRPDFQTALLLLARVYAAAGDATLAADTYRRLLEVNPARSEARAELAPLLAERGDLSGAAEILEQQLKAIPGDLQTLAQLAEVRLQMREFAAAEATARQMIAVKDQRGLGDFQLARILQAQKKYSEAERAFRAAIAQRPDDLLPLDGLVQTLVAAGKPDTAITELKSFLKTHPDQNQARYLLGVVHARQGDAAAARPLFEALIKAEPQVAVYHMALAGIEPTPEKRMATLRRGFEAVPGSIELGQLLAADYQRAGRPEDAIQVYEKLGAQNPGSEVLANNLASLLLDYRTDKASLRRALQLATPFASSTDPALVDTLGWAHYRNGDAAQAVSLLERAAAGSGQSAQIRYHLGMAYLGINNKVGAKAELARAVASKSTYPGLDEARETLAGLN